LALSVPVPSTVPPSLKVTVPVGETPVTVAVNVTDCPKLLGFCDEVSVTLVVLWPTVSVAVAVFPLPTLDVTALVVFTLEPALVPFTLTEKVHEAPAASVAPESATELLPAGAVMAPPPHEPVRPFGVETGGLPERCR